MLFPHNAIPKHPPIEANKALLLIDFQNDFVDPDGKLHIPNISNFVRNLPTLVNKFRSKGSIIWAHTQYSQPRLTASPETGLPTVILKQHLDSEGRQDRRLVSHAIPSSLSSTKSNKQWFQSLIRHDPVAFLDRSYKSNTDRPCMPDTAGVFFPTILDHAVDDKQDMKIVKSDYSAFAETSLLLQLRTRLITHVYVCGSLSNISVYATVLDAVRHGLEVTLIEDCLGYLCSKCHLEAVRQMADDMGASGVDYQELMDDLSGLLGDVIREEDFSSRFQVSLAPMPNSQSRPTVPPSQRNQRIEDWIAGSGSKRRQALTEAQGTLSKAADEQASVSNESQPKPKTSKMSSRQGTPDPSPPKKRSTSDVDDLEEPFSPELPPKSSSRREASQTESAQRKQRNKPRLRNTRSSQESSTRPLSTLNPLQSKSTGNIPDHTNMFSSSSNDELGFASPRPEATPVCQQQKKKIKKFKQTLGPTDIIGSGDCQLICDIVPTTEADSLFQILKETVQWQKMYHRSGEVPRLVAVQGDISPNTKDVPIYRHPADESPPLLPFDSTVESLRSVAEKHVGHPLNHVLIQWYRNSEDNISEHSDKTLDIVRGSVIVNMSFGAQRTMTLRTKKELPTQDPVQIPPLSSTPAQTIISPPDPQMELPTLEPPLRTTHRIPLPHASLFLLGPLTNARFLHSIRADKRPLTEKSAAEIAFNTERISLTFRHIGTFITPQTETNPQMIWGQGATGKTREQAKAVLSGKEADRKGEEMIRAFGVENHRAGEWRWEEWYGEGFDVVNFEGHEIGVGQG